jgi:hypothetical protein
MAHPIHVTPVFEVGIQGLNYVGNGQDAIAECPISLARFFNMLAGRRKRRLFSKSVELSQTAGSASSTAFRAFFRTSATANVIKVAMLCAPVDSTSVSITPRMRWELTEDPLGSPTTITQPYLHFGDRKTGTPNPSDIRLVIQSWDGTNGTTKLTGNTLYAASLVKQDFARVIACTIWEEPFEAAPAFTATFTPTTQFNVGAPIVDTPLSSVKNVQNLWKFSGSPPIFSWSHSDGASVQTSGTGFVNAFSGSFTTYGTHAPGFWSSPRYQGSFESNSVPISFVVRASDTGSNGTVTFVSSTGTLATVNVTSTVAAYYFQSGTLSATLDHQKIDVLVKTASGTHTLSMLGAACYSSSGEE